MSQSAIFPTDPAGAPQQVLEILTGFWRSRALVLAAELEIADVLAGEPLGIGDLAERTKTDAGHLFRVLRALESIGVFTQVTPGVFANTVLSDCLRRKKPGSQWAFVRMFAPGAGIYEAWGGLRAAMDDGSTAFENVHGCNRWDFLGRNPELGSLFNEAMRSVSAGVTQAVTMCYDWSRFPVIADIGGGIGTQLVDILNTHRSCRGILFDLPNAIRDAVQHERLQVIEGDFFDSIPVEADIYLLRRVLHDWPDDRATAILASVRAAIKPDARVAVIESIVPETAEPSPAKWGDLNMMIMTGGRERSVSEFQKILRDAGFELEGIMETTSAVSVAIARPSWGK